MKKSNGALETRANYAFNMNLTTYQAGQIIDGAEKRIEKLLVQLQEKEEPRQKAFDMYEQLQNEYDKIKHVLEEEKNLLEGMTRYKNNLGQTKPIRVLRATSHNEMKTKEAKKYSDKGIRQFTWTRYAAEILKEQNKMLAPVDLWEMVVEKFDIKARLEAVGKLEKIANIRWSAINICWKPNCEVSKGGGKMAESRGLLFSHNELMGLKEWATEDWHPRPEYIPRAYIHKNAS